MSTIELPRIVSREEWLDARKALQINEKELTRLRDRLAAERRALPWVKVEKEYLFDGRQGKVTLADLFEGRSQLFVKHFMMGPGAHRRLATSLRSPRAPSAGRRVAGRDSGGAVPTACGWWPR